MAEDREPKFDLIYSHGVHLDYHFCRTWDETGGCYGTNRAHGFSFDEAKENIAHWHEQEAQRWRDMTLAEWQTDQP